MINLQEIQNKQIEFVWIDGSFIKLNQPTVKMMTDLGAVGEDDEAMYKVLVKILNNNTSAKKFKNEDLENLTMQTLTALIKMVTDFQVEVDNHPN